MAELTPQIVKVARVGLGLNQTEFAKKCGLGKNTLPRVERSEGVANEGTWRLIEIFLKECGVSWTIDHGRVSVTMPVENNRRF